jgi:demethylmenaquinone methyltransferase/2-methoxy-6-polyprenyl-1,4-benzoquinol methylase
MAYSGSENMATDHSHRERARKNEFSKVWNSGLNAVFTDVAPYYDIASNFASLGLCSRWRERFVSSIDVKPGDRVLDVCAGTNGVGIRLMEKHPDLRIVALDRSEAMQEVGRRNSSAREFRIESIIGDAHRLPFPSNSFDAVTLQWASRHLGVVEVFSEIKRVLKPAGRFYHCDMLRPENKLVRSIYSGYLRACLSATARLFRSGPEARVCQDYFVRAVQMFYSSEELTELLTAIGFADVSSRTAAGGIVAAHRAVKA